MGLSTIIANIAHYLGEDKVLQFTIYQADGITFQNITGWALSFTLHTYGNPSNVFYTKTTGLGGIVLNNPTQGQCQVIINAADTVNLLANQYGFFLERTDSGSDFLPTSGLYTLVTR